MHMDRLEIFFRIQWWASEVIRGHIRSQKRSFLVRKSEIWSNAHDIWIDCDLFSEFIDVHIEVIQGHLRGQNGHFGVDHIICKHF